jgi:hypothetical protein
MKRFVFESEAVRFDRSSGFDRPSREPFVAVWRGVLVVLGDGLMPAVCPILG